TDALTDPGEASCVPPAVLDHRARSEPPMRGRGMDASVGSLARISSDADAESFGAGQNEVLQLIAEGASLREALEAIVLLIERQSEGMLCSILLVDERDGSVRHAAAPHLPREYVEAVDG